MERGPRVRLKELHLGEHARPLNVPGRLLRVRRALRYVVLAPLELGLTVLLTDPHRVSPVRRIRDHPDHLTVATVNAPAARKRAA